MSPLEGLAMIVVAIAPFAAAFTIVAGVAIAVRAVAWFIEGR